MKKPIRLHAVLTLARPARRRRLKAQPIPADLFGQIAVTRDDVRAWLRAVPRLDPDGPRADAYTRNYSVVEKIARAKAAGEFERIIAANEERF